MDYDGSDNQGHNRQLSGEGRSKSSSVPRPFAFPRFEFEDSLQGHLRFDNLVESEVFLGIQSQEDNQWIEDFSRGSNVIEFSSSATESCSITRRNNVWSEATSLESVELLLKSVGQEQIVPKDNIAEDSNTFNELGDLTKKMEPKFEHETVNSGYKRNPDASMPQDELLNNLSEVENHVEGNFTEVDEIISSQTHVVQKHESSSQMCADILEGDRKASVIEESLLLGTQSDDKIEGVQGHVHESLNRTVDGSSDTLVPTQGINTNTRILGSSQSPDQASIHDLESTDDLIKASGDDNKEQFSSQEKADLDTPSVEQPKVYQAVDTVDVLHSLSLSVECVDKITGADVIMNLNESTAMSSTQESQFQLLERVGKTSSLTLPSMLVEAQADAFSADAVTTAAMTSTNTLTGQSHVTKLNSLNVENCSIPQPVMDSALQFAKKWGSEKVDTVIDSSHKEYRSGADIPGSLSPSSLIRREDGNTINKIISTSTVDVVESLSFPVSSSSVELTKEAGGAESINDPHNVSAVIVVGSDKGFVDEAELKLSTVHESGDISIDGKIEENIMLCADVIDKSSETCVALICDQKMGSSTKVGSLSHEAPMVNQQQPGTDFIPCKRNNDHFEKEANVGMHEQPFGRDTPPADMAEETSAITSMVESLSTLNKSDQAAAEIDTSCKDKVDTCNDSTASKLSDSEGKLILVMETCNTVNGSESLKVDLSDCSKGLEALPDCDDLQLNKGNVAEGALSATDPQRIACNSPAIISPDDQVPDEKKQEKVKCSEFAESKQSTSQDLNVKDAFKDDSNFTFKVDSLPDVGKEKANNWTPFPIAAVHKSSVVLEGVTIPDVDKIQAILPPETSGGSPAEHAHGMPKTASGRKRRASGKGATKENSQMEVKGKEPTPDKPSRKRVKYSGVSKSPASSLPDQFMGSPTPPYGLTEQRSKNISTMAIAPCDVPDFKNHMSPSATYQQPFADLQQVQLRAQIFVYGSLIQGTAPDEACMVSAFGSSDRERGIWEPVWLAAKERDGSTVGESPSNSQSVTKMPESTGKQVSAQSKVFQSPVSQAGSKAISTTILSPTLPLSSPLWSISTPYHGVSQLSSQQRSNILDYQPAVSPLHHYQISPVRNIIGHTSWPSQAPSPSPWGPQVSALSVNSSFTTAQIKDSLLPKPSIWKASSSTLLSPTVGPNTLLAEGSQVPETRCTLSSELLNPDPKPRRRKKSQASNENPKNSLISQSSKKPIVASSSPTPAATPAAVSIPSCHVTASMADVLPGCPTPQPQVGRVDVEMAFAGSEETLGKVADAMLQAEEAAVLAATAISHWEGLWSQLAKQVPGTTQEAEVKIAAAAAAAAAAACVAKAAAAAARVASNAALQAKLMADEALLSSKIAFGAQSGSLVSNVHNVGTSTPYILTGDNGSNQSSSILVAAREAAKRRIEAASAAAKQAENLDAIVKAAELAAEAVSQAGKIVAMGEPLPLKEIINAGPQGYWNLSQGCSKLVLKSEDGNKEQMNLGGAEVAAISCKEFCGPSGLKGNEVTDQRKILPGELSVYSFDDNSKSAYAFSESVGVCEKDPGVDKNYEAPDVILADSSGVGSAQDEFEELGIVQVNKIKEGSIVEVYKDNDGLKPAWFSACVLSLHDGKAFVDYRSLLSKEGNDTLKEWVALEGEGGLAPRIRPVLPITASHGQGNKKRRRSAMGNYTWTVGDMVDASIQDSWREGIVTAKNENDETTLTVHFPARGETSAVSVQQVRPSRFWINGRWVERSRLSDTDHNTKSDMPRDKRPRLQSPSRSMKGKNQSLDEPEPAPVAEKPEDSKLLALSASDKVFNVGRSTKTEIKPDVRRTLRTGLQKEKSGVIFGVPKPGKRQKFVEVSKHFPADQNRKGNETKDSVKSAKYLVPQGPSSRGRRNLPRFESKEKQALKVPTTKSRSTLSRNLPQTDKLVGSSADHHEAHSFPEKNVEKSDAHEGNVLKNTTSSSGRDEAAEGPLSSLFANQLDGSFKKSLKTELLNKGKQVQFGGHLTKVDEEKVLEEKSDKEPTDGEPRRSNRRIQPTHRLLEGLQSSLVIPKMSSISHDKGQGQKSRVKNTSTRGKWL